MEEIKEVAEAETTAKETGKGRQVYELLFILDPSLDDARTCAIMDRISNDISEFGGESIKYFLWAKKQLAYPIKHRTEGQYFIMYSHFSPEFNFKKFERTLVLNDKVLRFLILKTDKVLDSIKFKEMSIK